MTRNKRPSGRLLALMLAGALLLSTWASPVFAEGAADEQPGASQEAGGASEAEQENNENPEGPPP